MATITFTGSLITTSCWCGIRLAVPSQLYEAAQSDSTRNIHCPIGHTFVYQQNEATRLRAQLDQAEAATAAERRRVNFYRELAEDEKRRAAAYKGHLTRARNRIVQGVCPVPGCKRSGFTQVMRHIATQHPDWLHDHPEVAATDG